MVSCSGRRTRRLRLVVGALALTAAAATSVTAQPHHGDPGHGQPVPPPPPEPPEPPEPHGPHGHHGHHGHGTGTSLATVSYIDVDALDLDAWITPHCRKPRAAAPAAAPASAAPTAAIAPVHAVSLVIGDAGELALQRDRPRFINDYDPGASGARKRERWYAEPAGAIAKEGHFELSIYPCQTTPNAAQRHAALELVQRSFRAARKHGWFEFATAEAAGFHRITGGDELHFVRDANLRDGRLLDPDAPEFLMYYQVDGKRTLTGVMYLMPDVDARGPQIGGPLTIWHYHTSPEAYCFRDGIMIGMPEASGRCAKGTPSKRTPEMLHVWFVPRRDGAFATDMIPPQRTEAPVVPKPVEGPAPATRPAAQP